MKLLFGSSFILILIFAASVESGLSSCSKDTTIYDTVTVVERDTITIKDSMLTDEILTRHPWKLYEARGVLEGEIMYYLRGGTNNTQSYDNESTVFYADKTGLLIDNAGYSHVVTSWNFANTTHTKLLFSLYDAPGVLSLYTWDNIKYKSDTLYYDDYYKSNYTGNDYHGQEIRIAK
jgi:hypothetical protein